MITDERITAYINSLDSGDGELCDEIAREAEKSHVPVIRRETAALLKTMVALKKPERILEVGTAVGYSALLIARVMPGNAHITTIEKFEKRIPAARRNFKRAGMEEAVTLLEGDAGGILAGLSGSFDFIFMDAAKGQYIHWLPDVIRLLAPGGLLMSDNVLQDGTIVESRYAVERRDRTIHVRMREYLYLLTHMENLETSILPVGDGVALSVLKEGNL
ncbi:O-methyltransferase [Lachnospiraceae bacterium 45-P1]